jgi:acetyl esterase/lipase
MFQTKISALSILLVQLALPVSVWAQSAVSPTNSVPTSAPAMPAPPPGIIFLHDIVIGKGGGRELHADVAYPKHGNKLMPGVVYVHGGGWFTGTYTQSPILRLAGAGYFAASIEYRLSTEAKWPAQIEDCKLGVRWMRANAATYHVDPNHIGAWGDSAGGHLAACLGTMGDVKKFEGEGGYPGVSSAVQAVVDFYGPIDFSNPAVWLIPKVSLFTVPYEQDPDLWKSASPLTYVNAGDPPILIAHGDSDRIVHLSNSIEFDAALTAAGVPHQFIIVKNADHGFRPNPGMTINPSWNQLQVDGVEFLAKYLKSH